MTDNSRIIASQDLTTAGFYDMADEWSDSRKIEKYGAFRTRDSYIEASGLTDLVNGDKVIVTWVDQGTHPSAIGDVGANAGQTPNSGYYVYNSGLQKLVRTAPLEPEVAKGFSDIATTKAQQVTESQNAINTIIEPTAGFTATELSGKSLPIIYKVVKTTGYITPGDGGAASYKIVNSQPSHPGKIALAGGLWAEIVGPDLPVEAFGAKGDCPDVSGYNPATEQAAIIASIGAATNDILAFQAAFHAAQAIGGATVTYGRGKIYRIAFDHTLGMWGLVVGNNTTLRRVGGGWLEFDPSLITGSRPSTVGLPSKRQWPDPGITTGDPVLALATSANLVAGTANVIAAGQLTEVDFTRNTHAIDVEIRCHIRTYWHALADQTSPYRRLRMYGLNYRFTINASYRNCYVKGTPNNGIHAVGREWVLEKCTAEMCGYGAVLFTAQNNITTWGYVIVGRPDLSGESFTVTGCVSRYAKDEGISYGGIKGIYISSFTSIGDHDRAIEGDESFATSNTASTVGQELNGDVLIDGVLQDGYHGIGTGTITSGSNQLQMSDAYLLSSDGSNGRYVFITGAGSGGSDGPFLISSVDYATNIVTLANNAAASVSNVTCYVKSRVGVTGSDTNQTRQTYKGLRLRNIYSLYHPVSLISRDNGRMTLEDIEMENVTVPLNFHGCAVHAEYATIRNVRYINCIGASNSAAASVRGTKSKVEDVDADTGFAFGVRAREFSGPASSLVIRGCRSTNLTLSAVRLDYTAKCNTIDILQNQFRGINSSGDVNGSIIQFATSTISADEITIRRNLARLAGKTVAPIQPTGGTISAGAIAACSIEENDFFNPAQLAYPAGTNPRSWTSSQNCFGSLSQRNNNLHGGRRLSVANTPSTGRHWAGDQYVRDFPIPGGVATERCTTGGNFATLSGVTVVTNPGTADVVLSDVSAIQANDTLVFSGPQTRLVTWVDRATNTVSLASTITALAGSTVAFATPVIKTETTLTA